MDPAGSSKEKKDFLDYIILEIVEPKIKIGTIAHPYLGCLCVELMCTIRARAMNTDSFIT